MKNNVYFFCQNYIFIIFSQMLATSLGLTSCQHLKQ